MVRGRQFKIRLKTPEDENGHPYEFEEGEVIATHNPDVIEQIARWIEEAEKDEEVSDER